MRCMQQKRQLRSHPMNAVLILGLVVLLSSGGVTVRAQGEDFDVVHVIAPRSAVTDIIKPTASQCTNPPQTIVHLSPKLSHTLGQVRGEYWYRVQLGSTGIARLEEVLCLPPDKDLTRLSRDTLLARAGDLVTNDTRRDVWLFHRVVLLTSDDDVDARELDIPSLGKITPADTIDTDPRLISTRKPLYPVEEWGDGHGGIVGVGAWVDRDGKVRYAEVIKSCGFEGLDSSAVKSAYGYKFAPATMMGKPIAVWVALGVRFETPWPLVTDHRGPSAVKPDRDGNYPEVYSSDILDSIEIGLPALILAYPAVTVVTIDSSAVSSKDSAPVFVWMIAQIKRFNKVANCDVVYCSRPGEGWEQSAIKAVKGSRLEPNQYCSVENGGYLHEVLFVPPGYMAAPETTFVSSPDDIIRKEVEPSLVKRATPKYPSSAKKSKAEGAVMVEAVIDCTGAVSWAGVCLGSGTAALDSAATESARKCLFVPGFKNGRAVASRVRWKVEFKSGD
ncbi:MAG: energy transducer TonB [Candidatus Zixiibacteriota bacterium]